MRKLLTKKVYVYVCAIYTRIYFKKIAKNRKQRTDSNPSNVFVINIV